MIIFKGSGGVRSGWRVAGFMVLVLGLIFALEGYVGQPLAALWHVDESALNVPGMFLREAIVFIAVLAALALAALLEHRSMFSYGLTPADAFGGKFWEGTAIGIVSAALVALAMYATGGFAISGFALRGWEWIVLPTAWAVPMLLVGFAEESWFRGYLLQTLSRGIGFWGAAAVTTLVFGGLHLLKADENFIDIFNIMALGLVMCFAIKRTGSLWLPIGFHSAFDFMQFFVIGTPNGGNRPVGTLLQASFPGPAWINGGPLGTEASYFMFPVMLLITLYVHYRYPPQLRRQARRQPFPRSIV